MSLRRQIEEKDQDVEVSGPWRHALGPAPPGPKAYGRIVTWQLVCVTVTACVIGRFSVLVVL